MKAYVVKDTMGHELVQCRIVGLTYVLFDVEAPSWVIALELFRSAPLADDWFPIGRRERGDQPLSRFAVVDTAASRWIDYFGSLPGLAVVPEGQNPDEEGFKA